MEIGSIIAICTTLVATIAGVSTIISTIRYMKSENSKALSFDEKLPLHAQATILKYELGSPATVSKSSFFDNIFNN